MMVEQPFEILDSLGKFDCFRNILFGDAQLPRLSEMIVKAFLTMAGHCRRYTH